VSLCSEKSTIGKGGGWKEKVERKRVTDSSSIPEFDRGGTLSPRSSFRQVTGAHAGDMLTRQMVLGSRKGKDAGEGEVRITGKVHSGTRLSSKSREVMGETYATHHGACVKSRVNRWRYASEGVEI